jgi:hypothetical protein
MLNNLLFAILMTVSASPATGGSAVPCIAVSDTLKDRQLIFNGRVWINRYVKIDGDQFFYKNEFVTGTVSANGRKFSNINLRYDIYNDELTAINEKGLILQLNKEIVDSFSLRIAEKDFKFMRTDSLKGVSGYVNVLYSGKSSLLVKYRKSIELMAVDRKTDRFYLMQKNYILKDSIAHPFKGRMELYNIISDKKKEIKQFVKQNRLQLSGKDPESFIPVIRFYDTLIN